MLDRLKDIRAKVLEWWNKFTSKQKTIIIAIAAIVIFAFAILIYVFSRPQYTRLMNCDTATQASTAMDTLEAAGIDCKLTNDGLHIDVNVNQISDANRALGAAGLTSTDPNIKDVTGAGMSATESDKQKLYSDFKRQELEQVFKSYDAVRA